MKGSINLNSRPLLELKDNKALTDYQYSYNCIVGWISTVSKNYKKYWGHQKYKFNQHSALNRRVFVLFIAR